LSGNAETKRLGATGPAERPVSTTTVGNDPMLVIADLSVTFGGVRALNGVDASVDLHGITAVVGPNGAGKTTLLNGINGFLRGRLRGRITINGRDTTTLRPADLAALGVARSFQEPRLIEETTVLDNVLGGAHVTMRHGVLSQLLLPRLAAREEAVAVERAMALLEVMEMKALAATPISRLSYGHRKLVDLARAVMRRPDLLLLDEPSSGLDEREQAALADTLRRLHERERTTIVLVEHHMTLVRAVADRMVAMQSGRAVVAGHPEVVLESREFKDAIVGQVHDDADQQKADS
jgi:branched-chain amino acid transport system ATP-binding protein